MSDGCPAAAMNEARALGSRLHIAEADPQGQPALALLAEAAAEAAALYPELHDPARPGPGNPPTPPGGVYLLAWLDGVAVGSGALRPLPGGQAGVGELRRLFVCRHARRQGVAAAIVAALEARAPGLGYRLLRLETGCRQTPAVALYTALGWRRIEPFGPYADDPTSVCFEKPVGMPPAEVA